MTESVEASLTVRRLAQDLAAFQWISALALVALASFGTFSWLLELRSHEFAVRLALGDTPAGVTWRAVQSMLWLVALASLLGLALYLPASQVLRSLLFGVDVLSPIALFKAISGVSVAALSAAAIATKMALQRLSLDVLRNPGLR